MKYRLSIYNYYQVAMVMGTVWSCLETVWQDRKIHLQRTNMISYLQKNNWAGNAFFSYF